MRTRTANGVEYYQDFDKTEGGIVIVNPKTLDIYKESRKQMYVFRHPEVFYVIAFTQEDFKSKFKEEISKRNLEGKQIYSGGYGMYGTKEGLDAFKKNIVECKLRIFNECNPQEVYFYEWNNHECMFEYGDDSSAWGIVKDIFGAKAKNVKRLKY